MSMVNRFMDEVSDLDESDYELVFEVLSSNTNSDFGAQLTQAVKDGWSIQGNITLAKSQHGTTYAILLSRYEIKQQVATEIGQRMTSVADPLVPEDVNDILQAILAKKHRIFDEV